jgi:sugar lactone lactonase YvrE
MACAVDIPSAFAPAKVWAALPPQPEGVSIASITIDRRQSIWVALRCSPDCTKLDIPTILRLSPSGRILKALGRGQFVQPHGLAVARNGDVWVADVSSNGLQGNRVVRLDGKGRVRRKIDVSESGAADIFRLDQPTAVAESGSGTVYVAEGHAPRNANSRVSAFSRAGRLLSSWGGLGTSPHQMTGPHALALDSRRRLVVADRGNKAIKIFDQHGRLLNLWRQFGTPSGLFIDHRDRIYIADSGSEQFAGQTCRRGIWVADASTGRPISFTQGPPATGQNSGPENLVVNKDGRLYWISAGSTQIMRADPIDLTKRG